MVENNPGYDSTQADVRCLLGDQGTGKTNTAVALVVDDCYAHLTGIINPKTGEYYKARPLNENEQKFLASKKIAYHKLKHIRVFGNDGSSKIVVKPAGWVIDSPIKVFSNFHFYGVRFRYIEVETIIENINSDVLMNGWIVLDESILTDKRDTMTTVGKMMAWFGAQARRRKLHMIIIAQYANMLQSRFNLFATTRVQCSYDKNSHIISLDVNRTSEFMDKVDFYAPDYWKFFKHDELVKVPQSKVDKVMAELYAKK